MEKERDNKKTNKTMVKEELIEKNRQGNHYTHWHQRIERPLEKERDNKETNKTMVMEELLEKSRQGDSWTHWHQRREKPLKTLNCDFQKLETSLWENDTRKTLY